MSEPTVRTADPLEALVARCGVDQGDRPRQDVLVIGPWLAGSTSLADALRRALPGRRVVEAGELAAGAAPAAVVFVVSAVAPLTGSDCALLDTAAAGTDLLVVALTKIDVHRSWREVLAANRTVLDAHHPRYRDITWVPVAAAPAVGERQLDGLVGALRRGLDDPALPRRNQLRAWQGRIDEAIRGREEGTRAREERMAVLRDRRHELVRRSRLSRSADAVELRSQIQQARVRLTYLARSRCSSVRTGLQEDAAAMPRRRLPVFERHVRSRVAEIIDDVDMRVTAQMTALGAEACDSSHISPRLTLPAPPPMSGRPETRLIALLGAGFGLGVAFTVNRLFAGLLPGYTATCLLAGAVAGLLAAVWIIGIRGLLYQRAVADRWVSEVIADVRAYTEELVATELLRAEAALIARERTVAVERADLIAVIDAELHEHSAAAARDSEVRDRELPMLCRARDAVAAALRGHNSINLNRSCE